MSDRHSVKVRGTELVALYDTLGLMREQERLEMTRWLADRPDVLAEMFRHSVTRFSRSRISPEEPFNRQGREAPGPGSGKRARTGPEIVDGRHLAILLHGSGGTWSVDADGEPPRTFTYVDFEVQPALTTPPPPAERGRPPTSTEPGARAVSIDLLLRAEDGAPVVAEVKVKEDRDAFYALIQALAAAAQLVTPSQRERLREQYPELDSSAAVEVWLVIVPRTSAGQHHQHLLAQARRLAAGLSDQKAMAPFVRRIAFVDVTSDEGRLSFTRQPLGSAAGAGG